MHAAATWFADNVAEAAPTHVQLNHHVRFDDEADAGMRVATVRQFAARHGLEVQTNGTIIWADLRLIEDGIRVTYSVLTNMINSGVFL